MTSCGIKYSNFSEKQFTTVCQEQVVRKFLASSLQNLEMIFARPDKTYLRLKFGGLATIWRGPGSSVEQPVSLWSSPPRISETFCFPLDLLRPGVDGGWAALGLSTCARIV